MSGLVAWLVIAGIPVAAAIAGGFWVWAWDCRRYDRRIDDAWEAGYDEGQYRAQLGTGIMVPSLSPARLYGLAHHAVTTGRNSSPASVSADRVAPGRLAAEARDRYLVGLSAAYGHQTGRHAASEPTVEAATADLAIAKIRSQFTQIRHSLGLR